MVCPWIFPKFPMGSWWRGGTRCASISVHRQLWVGCGRAGGCHGATARGGAAGAGGVSLASFFWATGSTGAWEFRKTLATWGLCMVMSYNWKNLVVVWFYEPQLQVLSDSNWRLWCLNVSKMSNGVPLCYWLFSCVLATPGLSNLVSSSCLPCFSAILKSRCSFLWKCYIQYLQPTTSTKKKLNIQFFSENISSSLLTKKSKKHTSHHIRLCLAIRVIILCNVWGHGRFLAGQRAGRRGRKVVVRSSHGSSTGGHGAVGISTMGIARTY